MDPTLYTVHTIYQYRMIFFIFVSNTIKRIISCLSGHISANTFVASYFINMITDELPLST